MINKAAILVMWTPDGKRIVEHDASTTAMIDLAKKIRVAGTHNKAAIRCGEVWDTQRAGHVFRFHCQSPEQKKALAEAQKAAKAKADAEAKAKADAKK